MASAALQQPTSPPEPTHRHSEGVTGLPSISKQPQATQVRCAGVPAATPWLPPTWVGAELEANACRQLSRGSYTLQRSD